MSPDNPESDLPPSGDNVELSDATRTLAPHLRNLAANLIDLVCGYGRATDLPDQMNALWAALLVCEMQSGPVPSVDVAEALQAHVLWAQREAARLPAAWCSDEDALVKCGLQIISAALRQDETRLASARMTLQQLVRDVRKLRSVE